MKASRDDLLSSDSATSPQALGGPWRSYWVTGPALADLTPNELMEWSACFGSIDHENFVAREDKQVQGLPILRIGNTLDKNGNKNSNFARFPAA